MRKGERWGRGIQELGNYGRDSEGKRKVGKGGNKGLGKVG